MRIHPKKAFLIMALAFSAAGFAPVAANAGDGEPSDPVAAHVELGVSYYNAGRYDVAQEEAMAALKDSPKNSDALTLLGLVHLALKEMPQAEKSFRAAIDAESSNADARNNLGLILCQTGRIDEGVSQFGHALATPRYPHMQMVNTLINAGTCLESKPDYSAAERYFLKALEAEPFYPAALYQLALLYHKTGRDKEAASRLEVLHRQVAPNAASLFLGMEIATSLGDAAGAKKFANLITLEFPSSPEAFKLSGNAGN